MAKLLRARSKLFAPLPRSLHPRRSLFFPLHRLIRQGLQSRQTRT
jgi:hypothetical protein